MPSWASSLRPTSGIGSCAVVGSVVLSAAFILRPLFARRKQTELWVSSPREESSRDDCSKSLPYPPDALPGARDVHTPYGDIHVFEWGPEDGEKVLLLPGLSTPCLALGDLAERLVEAGYRVMLFDLFGRGYSDAPVDVPYDIRLYTAQILLVLASSGLSWTGDNGFHLLGYSLGGGLAVSFAAYFAHMVRSLTLVAGAGLIRRRHLSWASRLLYSSGLLPEWVLHRLVEVRLSPKQRKTTAGAGSASREGLRHKNSDASGGDSFDRALVSRRRQGCHTVASVVAWQLRHHRGFVAALTSTIRHAPIYEQRADWEALAGLLSARRRAAGEGAGPGLLGGKVLLVLGESDPVIVKEELIPDATEILGPEGYEVALLACGHEIAIARGEEVADAAVRFWRKQAGKSRQR